MNWKLRTLTREVAVFARSTHSRLLDVCLVFVLLAGLTKVQTLGGDNPKNKAKDKSKSSDAKQEPPERKPTPIRNSGKSDSGGSDRSKAGRADHREGGKPSQTDSPGLKVGPADRGGGKSRSTASEVTRSRTTGKVVPLTEKTNKNGTVEKTDLAGKVEETTRVDPKTGIGGNPGRSDRGDGKSGSTGGDSSKRMTGADAAPPPPTLKHVRLTERKNKDGAVERVAPSGKVREAAKIDPKTGIKRTQHITPTGRVEREVLQKRDGSRQTKYYAPTGKVAREEEEVVNQDGTKAITTREFDRDGDARIQQTVRRDNRGKETSKTVVVKTPIIVKNTTIINNKVERHYARGHYGYVYRPAYVVGSPVFVSWYDPYWYPAGVATVHPFRYSWGWESHGWYNHYHGPYWVTYDVYPAPSYWVTDWLVAGYVADHHAATVSAAQAREEARLAREEAEKARLAAEEARDEAEIAEVRVAQAQAELRVKNADERAARAEREEARASKPNPNATPIDMETKEALKNQIEQTIAEKKQLADESEKAANPILPDLSKTLADPKHIYPVSKTVSVISAKDQSPAGNISEGDLLKLEPGQVEALKDANENSLVTMRVITSKGGEGEVVAGTLVSVPLKDLQEFDNEFRAKLDLGLAEADKNKDLFKQAAQ